VFPTGPVARLHLAEDRLALVFGVAVAPRLDGFDDVVIELVIPSINNILKDPVRLISEVGRVGANGISLVLDPTTLLWCPGAGSAGSGVTRVFEDGRGNGQARDCVELPAGALSDTREVGII